MYLGGKRRVVMESGTRTPTTIKCYSNKSLILYTLKGKMHIQNKTNGGKPCLTMCDCPLGTLYSNTAVPSESRKVILLGRSILEPHRDNVSGHRCAPCFSMLLGSQLFCLTSGM